MSSKRTESPGLPLCRFAFLDGRRCTQPAHAQGNGLCYTHAHAPHRRLRPSDLSRELATPPGGLVPPEKIQRLLKKLPLALADGTITPRQAGVMAHLCNLLLGTARLARGEQNPDPNDLEWRFVSSLLAVDDEPNDHENDALSSHPANG